VRVATWNLERGGRTRAAAPAQRQVLAELAADVVALTEPPASLTTSPGVVASPARRVGSAGEESWVAIAGTADVEPIDLDIPYERMAVAARASAGDQRVVVYCAVLPWLAVTRHAPYLVRPGEKASDVFARVLREQVDDITTLRRRFDEPVLWPGDFNQSLEGPLAGCSGAGRVLLQAALDSLGYAAWNASASHARDGLCAVDLLCGPRELAVHATGRIDPRRDGVVMSDHAGYWVDL
jgi:endonuclease/exonuclease/phosphatase family metal-dependent hydrolase